jgi:hypothetical protein
MDELRLVTALRPTPAPHEASELRQAVRMRLNAVCNAPAGRAPRRRPVHRQVALGTAAIALAGATLTTVMAIEGPAIPSRTAARIATAAWVVQANHDRTVTITISQLRDPEGLQNALRGEGIPAIVRYTPMVTERVNGQEVTGPACDYRPPASMLPPSVAQAVIVAESGPGTRPRAQQTPVSGTLPDSTPLFVLTIRPGAMPPGSAILIQAAMSGSSPATAVSMPSAFGLAVLTSDHLPRCVPFSEWLRQAGVGRS